MNRKMNDTFSDGHDELYHHAEVSGVENIGQCGRLSQLSWLLGAL